MTKALYDQIKAYFIQLWGPYAGWAHSVLFTADLKAFKLAPQGEGFAIKLEAPIKEEEVELTEIQINHSGSHAVEGSPLKPIHVKRDLDSDSTVSGNMMLQHSPNTGNLLDTSKRASRTSRKRIKYNEIKSEVDDC